MPPKRLKKVKTKDGKDIYIKKSEIPTDDEEIKPEIDAGENQQYEEEDIFEEEEQQQEIQHSTLSSNTNKEFTSRTEPIEREKARNENINEEREAQSPQRSEERSHSTNAMNKSSSSRSSYIQYQSNTEKEQQISTEPEIMRRSSISPSTRVKSPTQKRLMSPPPLEIIDTTNNSSKRIFYILLSIGFLFLFIASLMIVSLFDNKEISSVEAAEDRFVSILSDPFNPLDKIKIDDSIPKIFLDYLENSDKLAIEDDSIILKNVSQTRMQQIVDFCKKYPKISDFIGLWLFCFFIFIVWLLAFLRSYFILLPKAKQIIRQEPNQQCFVSNVKTTLNKEGYSTFLCWRILCSLLKESASVQFNSLDSTRPFFSISSP